MTLDDFNAFCATLPHATQVVQWGGSHVWNVGGKVFAIGGWTNDDALGVTFKCSRMSFDLLKQEPGLRPAPYLASRGMSWLQRVGAQSMDDATLKDYLRASQRLVALGLTRKLQRELGFEQPS
jgi:predicted DNA-binding protein (MmcQ/YjbR family)